MYKVYAFFLQAYRHVHVEYECEILYILSPADIKSKQTSLTEFPSNKHTPDQDQTPPKDSNKDSEQSSTQALNIHGNSSPASNSADQDSWPVYVELTNGKVYGCDLVVSATGVVPNTSCLNIVKEASDGSCELELSGDGGIIVDSEMRSSLPNVYAAGDVCSVKWDDQPDMWFQVNTQNKEK